MKRLLPLLLLLALPAWGQNYVTLQGLENANFQGRCRLVDSDPDTTACTETSAPHCLAYIPSGGATYTVYTCTSSTWSVAPVSATDLACTDCVGTGDLDLALVPTWTGAHVWSSTATFSPGAGGNLLALADGYALWDMDDDGDGDYVLCGDRDADGGLGGQDINTCILDVTDSDSNGTPDQVGVVELMAGTYTLDEDADGVGDTYASTGKNPHVRLPSGITLKGQGHGVTVLSLNASTTDSEGYGQSPLVGVNVDSDTDAAATTRVSDIVVRDLTVQTANSTSQNTTNTFVPGVQLWDCDRCLAVDVEARELPQAAVHMTRVTDTWARGITATHVGNYDSDGSTATDTPVNTQPCLYLYSSAGVENKNSGYVDSMCDGIGGIGVNIRSQEWIARDVPYGEDSFSFDGAADSASRWAQTFVTDSGGTQRPSAIWAHVKVDHPISDPTTALEVAIYPTSTGTPTTPVVTGYDFTDWQVDQDVTTDGYDFPNVGKDCRLIRFVNTNTSRAALSASTTYALNFRYTTDDEVRLCGDDQAAANTYTGGSLFTGTSDPATTAYATANADLNFWIETGLNKQVAAKNIHVKDITGVNLASGLCMSLGGGSVAATVSGIQCADTGGLGVMTGTVTVGLSLGPVLDGVTIYGHRSSNSSPPFFVGPYAPGAVIIKASVTGIKNSSQDCTQFKSWTGQLGPVTVRDSVFSQCGQDGTTAQTGTRNITFLNTDWLDVGQSVFSMTADMTGSTDGVSHTPDNWAYRGGTIVGGGDAAFEFDNATTDMGRFTIDGMTTYHLGYAFFNNNAFGNVGAGPWFITRNTINGFCWTGDTADSECDWGIRIEGQIDPLFIEGNRIQATSGNEERGVQFDWTNTDNVVFANNFVTGAYATWEIGGTGAASKTIMFYGNVLEDSGTPLTWNDASVDVQFQVRPDGKIAWGPGSGDNDLMVTRGSGAGLSITASGATICLDIDTGRIFHDDNCDGTKDVGEDYIDCNGAC